MKQHLSFSELYRNCRESAEKTLLSLWCGETWNESQRDYANQIRNLVASLFAPANAIPLVECTNRYRAVSSVTPETASNLVGGLWDKSFPPYEHQYDCWNTVLNEKTEEGKLKSFVITTGTGSGKTECFMLPLVHDLKNFSDQKTTQAIFLYPLNALMEDQKERLEDLLKDTKLRYCVFNGDLPEKEPKSDDTSDYAREIRKRIDAIKGIERDSAGNIIEYKFQHCIATRDQLRREPAQILLTNPTMLEYILLRTADSSLITPGSLRWIVIDETHTYTGAGAAEMAMLLRRVMLAFEEKPSDIRFATSSATLGNPKNETERTILEEKLKRFIADLTGLPMNQIKVIGGKRKGKETIPDNEDKKVWETLIASTSGYIGLKELFGGSGTIEENLQKLDEMCSRLPENTEMKVKVHFFFRVPNNGLFVRLNKTEGGSFKIFTEKPTDLSAAPLIELSRCRHCGEYVAIAQINRNDGTYGPILMDESDMFELTEEEEEKSNKFVFARTNRKLQPGDNNIGFSIEGNRFIESPGLMNEDGEWRTIANTQNRCPHCNSKLTKPIGDDRSDEVPEEEDCKKLLKFRFSTDLISRIIAPKVLDQLVGVENPDGLLHKGQQYISFVDSRQGAARGSLGQNIEQEKLWVYSTIFHELNRRANEAKNVESRIKELQNQLIELAQSGNTDGIIVLTEEIKRLEAEQSGLISWNEIAILLESDPISDKFAAQFAKRSAGSDELDENGNVLPLVKRKYIQSIMVEFLGKRPLHSASPETMGIFTTAYPSLSQITNLPEAVENFNHLIESESLKISLNDWKNLIQLFLDYQVRSNESIFLRLREDDPLDIKSCVRFATQRQRRRTVHKPLVSPQMPSRIVRYLAQLLVDEGLYISHRDAIRNEEENISQVIDALWLELTENSKLLEHGTQYDSELGRHKKDRDVPNGGDPVPWRLNVANLSFKLFDRVALTDTNTNGSELSAKRYRPINVWFKNYSPYLKNRTQIVNIDKELFAEWKSIPEITSVEQLQEWAKKERKLLWNNNLWGEEGVFSERLNSIYIKPDLFVQSEHTAQVDKLISRKVQKDFKDHKLNILACSTTMEMGVDLGDLELVMMSSVPPQPSNYKQRAGRSGRNNYVKSVAITLCGSDAIGLRTQLDPLGNMIERKMADPETDLNSAQVIQRHVNAFLIREFGVFSMSRHPGSISQKVADYYTNFDYGREGNHIHYYKAENVYATPVDGLGDSNRTPYERFNECCLEALPPELKTRLLQLLKGTIYDGRLEYVVQKALESNVRCYAELEWNLEGLGSSYREASTEKYRNYLMIKYLELLDKQLLSFWATNRFIPNANMPVGVVTFDVNSEKADYYKASTTSNPSYSLRDALQQYAPGNSVVIDGRVYVVRGLRYTDFFKRNVSFKTLYHNKWKTVIDQVSEITDLLPWPVNRELGLPMIQPTEFLPDINETENRIMATNVYTRVNPQLIGASDWTEIVTEPHLFSLRNSREDGAAKILYYNDGQGYGYCHCTRCGRTVLENRVADSSHKLDRLPAEFNNRESEDPNKPDYHFDITKKNRCCGGSNNPELIKRNVILGDLIQTDYTEIRIRFKGKSKWLDSIGDNYNLLVTLGLVFRRSLAEILGKETTAIDFAITPNAHICIFDTNPGGAGYSNQLANMDLMKEVIKRSKEMLKKAGDSKSTDMLLDKFSLRYLENIDINKAMEWIDNELENSATIPVEVTQIVGPSAQESSLSNLIRAVSNCEGDIILFADNDYERWNYGDSDEGWRGHLLNYFQPKGTRSKFVIIENENSRMNEPIKKMARDIASWTHGVEKMANPFAGNNLYPLAFLNGRLYLTNNRVFANLNDKWGNGTIFVVEYNMDLSGSNEIDLEIKPTTAIVKIEGDSDKEINSKSLGKLIEEKAQNIIKEFMAHIQHSEEPINITYQDEHLKSVLGIILTLQTIEHFVKKFGKEFKLEFRVEKYQDIQRRQGIAVNLQGNGERDMFLSGLTKKWLDELEIHGELIPVCSLDRNQLTHWRELSFECGSKKLSIYPDGGILNGWIVSRNNIQYFIPENSDSNSDILLSRTHDIKIDVALDNND